ncbi:hypothetical protein K456DRAFT_1752845 [Colletotrichum gloeosporioides 23]|nr:hypothetical protein K456DRAFT_1752845 [Colletotrichum gloeosporioides 23]
MRDLFVTNPEDDKKRIEEDKGGLLESSYGWILKHEDFQKWYDNREWQVFWIKGPPGTGKTMLMCGIIDHLTKSFTKEQSGRHLQVFYFFCEAGDTARNNAEAVLRGLIWSCLKIHPAFISLVKKKHPIGNALFTEKNAWYALLEMLRTILSHDKLKDAVLLVDALDECSTESRHKLLDFINESKEKNHVRWVLSSRNWQSIECKLGRSGLTLDLDLELSATMMSEAVGAYINHRVDDLTQQYQSVGEEIWSQFKSRLQLRADGIFLWVAMVCDRLKKDCVPQSNILSRLDAFPAGLDSLFERMLTETSWPESDYAICKEVLATAVVLYRPVNLDEMRSLVQPHENFSPEDWDALVRSCSSFLSIRDPDSLISTRSRGLLRDKFDYVDWPNRPAGVQANSSNNSLSDQVSYACLFWVDHLQERGGGDFQKDVGTFTEVHFLHWLEALARIGRLSEGARAVVKLGAMPLSLTGCPPAFWEDASRVLTSFGSIIQEAPIQAYGGALAFCPTSNSIRRKFWDQRVRFLKDSRGISEKDSLLQALKGQSGTVTAMTFSPDGKVLASCSSYANVIMLWHTATGELWRALEGHSSPVRTAVFSPDGELIASGSEDGMIKLWHTTSGKLKQTLNSSRQVAFTTAIAFSPDQRYLASATSDANVEIWDITTGDMKHAYTGNDGWVTAVAFSSSGRVVAAGSGNGHVRLWDTTLDTSSLKPYEDRVDSVDVSPNGKLVASTSSDKTVRLWNVATGRCETILEGHTDRITTAVFSPTGELIASASCDKTIRLWDTRTGKYRRHLRGHTNDVTSVCFSSHGTTIAPASKDRTVRLWCTNKDWRLTLPALLAPSKESSKTFEGHRLSVNAVCFSPDGKAVVSASDDGTARVWNIETGSHVSLTGGKARFIAVAFSTNGTKVAAASADRNIRWWDVDNGYNAGEMKAPGHPPSTYGFWTFPFHENGEEWIKRNGREMLKPPEEYRANCLAMQGNTVVQGHRNGKVTFLELDLSP